MSKLDNLVQFPDSMERAACDWLAKLDRGDLSTEEKSGLSEWLAIDPLHRVALADQMAEWSEMDLLSELTHLAVAPSELTRVDQFNSLFGWNKPAPYLGGLIVLAAVGFFTTMNTADFAPAELDRAALVVGLGLEAAVGEQIHEALPDGSIVHVNTTSAAEVSYSLEERSVQLKAGERPSLMWPQSQIAPLLSMLVEHLFERSAPPLLCTLSMERFKSRLLKVP